MREEDLLHAESFRDRVSTVTESGKRKWIYALKPSGKFTNARNILAVFYLAIFFIMPFIKVNGMPFFMINIPEGRFIIFSKIFWPQDFFIFAIAMITFIIFIVLFTVAFGRLFCGWACPQTFLMEFVFRKIEWWIEGSPAQQRKLDEGPWTKEKILKKGLKHFVFFGISFLIANTFLSYIIGVDKLWAYIREPISQHFALLAGLLVFTFFFYGVFAYVREIVCTTICPYGRLQGVMFDKDTMQISYDYSRGEPRGKFKKGEVRTLGDCVNCFKCVAVCPTGIDIRDGVQMECVGCTACIDACDEVMEHVNLPKGLIRYASENEIREGKPFTFTPRMKAYTVLLLILTAVMITLVATRKTVDTYISRVKGQLYQVVEGDKVSNLFDAKIINKTNQNIPITLKVEDRAGEVKLVGRTDGIQLKKEAVNEVTFFVEIPKSALEGRTTNVKIGVYQDGKKLQTIKTKFLGPLN